MLGCQLDFNSMASKSTGSASKYLKVPLLLPSVKDDSGDDNDDNGNGDDAGNDNEEEEEEEGDDIEEREKVKCVAGRKKEAEEKVVVEVEVGAPIQSEEADIIMMKNPNSNLNREINTGV
jgi:hypothetical protein